MQSVCSEHIFLFILLTNCFDWSEVKKTNNLHFAELVLDETGLFGRRNGEKVNFTKSERALLLALSRNPGRLMSRSQLLGELISADSGPSDRNVDYLINRLRTKLGDNARSPRYIATQYGEGYVWIAAPSQPATTKPDTFLAIAPVLPSQSATLGYPVAAVAMQLREAIAKGLGSYRRVIVIEQEKPVTDISPRYLLKLSFNDSQGRQFCTATLQEMPSGQIMKVFSLRRDAEDRNPAASLVSILSSDVIDYLQQIMTDMTAGLGIPSDLSLEDRLWSASNRLTTGSQQMWLAKGEQLNRDREADPSIDTALQWCLHLFSRLVVASPFSRIDYDERDRIESEMEETALRSLPAIENNPVQMLAAAKLLYFVNRGHLALAQDVAERAAKQMAGSAAALPLLAQICSAQGRANEAFALLQRSIEMSGSNFEFFIHANVLKCIALLAAGESQAAAGIIATIEYLGDHCPPAAALAIGLMVAPTDRKLPDILTDALVSAGSEGSGNALEFLYFTSARQHVSPVARRNVMRVMTAHVTGVHGETAVPAFLRSNFAVPGRTAPLLGACNPDAKTLPELM